MPNADLLEIGEPVEEKPKLFVGVCLDQSSSMGSIYQETISNFNEQFDEIINGSENNDTSVSLAVFGSEAEMIYFNEPVERLEKLSEENYRPNGMTAYFEAVGMMIDRLNNVTKDLNEDNYSVLLLIVSDGGHNKNLEYTPDQVRGLIKEAEAKKNWTITCMGANQTAQEIAAQTGISVKNIMNFTATRDGLSQGSDRYRSSLRSFLRATPQARAVYASGHSVAMADSGGFFSQSDPLPGEDPVQLSEPSQPQYCGMNVGERPNTSPPPVQAEMSPEEFVSVDSYDASDDSDSDDGSDD